MRGASGKQRCQSIGCQSPVWDFYPDGVSSPDLLRQLGDRKRRSDYGAMFYNLPFIEFITAAPDHVGLFPNPGEYRSKASSSAGPKREESRDRRHIRFRKALVPHSQCLHNQVEPPYPAMNFTDFRSWPVWLQIALPFAMWVALYPWRAKTHRGRLAHLAAWGVAILFYFLFLRRVRH